MLSATVHALYSAPGMTLPHTTPPSATPNTGSARHRPTHIAHDPVAADYQVRRPSGPEYDVTPDDHYDVDLIELGSWRLDGLAPVAELAVSVRAAHPRGLIRALKDLYDTHVAIDIDGRTLEACFATTSPFGKRALVIEMTGGVDGPPDTDEARRLVAALMFKDADITYDPAKTDIEAPNDLNAPDGSEIFVWTDQTLVWRMHPVARERHGSSFTAVTATIVACRQATDELLTEVRALRDTPPDRADERLASIAAAQATLERDIQPRLDLLSTNIGRPAAAHLAALVRQTAIDQRIESLADLLARSQRTVELELALDERRLSSRAASSAADVRTVVVVFAVVSVLLGIASLVLELGSLPEPADARIPRLPTAIATAVLVSLGAVAVAVTVLLAARIALRADLQRTVRVVTAVVAVSGCAGLIWVVAAAELWLLVVALGLVLASAMLVAWQLRLSPDPD